MTLRITHYERPLVLPDSTGRTHAILAKGRIFSRGPVEEAWIEKALAFDNYATEEDVDRLAEQRRVCVKRPIRLRAELCCDCQEEYALLLVDPSAAPAVDPSVEARQGLDVGEARGWFCCDVVSMSWLDGMSASDVFYEHATMQVANALSLREPDVLATDLAVAFIGWAHRVLGADLALTDITVDLSDPEAPA